MPDLIPTPFAVVRYTPDVIRNEPINVGVVAEVEGQIRYRLLSSMGRLKAIMDPEEADSLDVALRFLRSSLDREPRRNLPDIVGSYQGQITLSEPLGALTEDPLAFLDDQYEVYVRADSAAQRASQGETRVKMRQRIRQAIASFGKSAETFAISRTPVRGHFQKHAFDFGFVNGQMTLLEAISFQNDPGYALRESKIVALAAIDTKEQYPETLVAAVVAPPVENSDAYQEARAILGSKTKLVENDGDLESLLQPILTSPDLKPVPNDFLYLSAHRVAV